MYDLIMQRMYKCTQKPNLVHFEAETHNSNNLIRIICWHVNLMSVTGGDNKDQKNVGGWIKQTDEAD